MKTMQKLHVKRSNTYTGTVLLRKLYKTLNKYLFLIEKTNFSLFKTLQYGLVSPKN